MCVWVWVCVRDWRVRRIDSRHQKLLQFTLKVFLYFVAMKTSIDISLTMIFVTARSELRGVLFLALSVTFLFAYEICRDR